MLDWQVLGDWGLGVVGEGRAVGGRTSMADRRCLWRVEILKNWRYWIFKASLKGRRCLRRVEILKKHEKMWRFKRFCCFFFVKIIEKRLECHNFLANKHEHVWHSKRFCWFYVKIIENAWSVTLVLLKNMKTCDTPSVLTDFRWKSLKTLGVSHFSCKKHEKSITLQEFRLILG